MFVDKTVIVKQHKYGRYVYENEEQFFIGAKEK